MKKPFNNAQVRPIHFACINPNIEMLKALFKVAELFWFLDSSCLQPDLDLNLLLFVCTPSDASVFARWHSQALTRLKTQTGVSRCTTLRVSN